MKQFNEKEENLNEIISISKRVLRIVYLILIFVGAYLILRILNELKILNIIITILKTIAPFFIGVVVAWLLNPFVRWLESKNVRRGIGVAFAYLLLIGCLFLLIKAIIPLLYNQTIDLVENLPNISSDVKSWIQNIFEKMDTSTINIRSMESSLFERLDVFSKSLATEIPSLIINTVSAKISYIGTFIIGLVIGFYLLLSCNNLSNTLLEFIPKKYRDGTHELCVKIETSLRSYVNGAFLDALLVFIVSSIVFAIIGLKAPLLFGLFCGLMNVIPYAGPYIGGAPAVIVGFSQGTGIGIAVLIAIIIIQSLEGNILQTLIISKTTKLNPVIIILGLLIFGHFFGIIGMLLSTPIIGVVKVIIKYFDDKYDLLSFK